MLQWAHENGCPWDKRTCADAAVGGNLEVLQYAHQNGCPWDEDTWDVASGSCSEYLVDHGCPGAW